MILRLPRKLPQRINLIWMSMSIPLVVMAVFCALILYRFPDFADDFESFWQLHSDVDEINRILNEARHAQVVMIASGQSEHQEAFTQRMRQVSDRLQFLATHALLPSMSDRIKALFDQSIEYVKAGTDLEQALARLQSGSLAAKVKTLEADALVVLDVSFLQTSNEITKMSQVFGCPSRLTASRLFREDIDILLARLDQSRLALPEKIRIHSNLNAIRSDFAAALLACQDFDRAIDNNRQMYESINAGLLAIEESIDAKTLTLLNDHIDSESRTLTIMFAIVLAVFASGVALTFLISHRFGRQLREMTQTIRSVASGGYDGVVPNLGLQDDFGELAANVETFRRNALDLSRALQDARQANEAKSQFLASISHELRTPLNAIIGFSEIIRDGLMGPIPSNYRDYAHDIQTSAQVLLEQIAQILDLSRIEMGHLEIETSDTDIESAITVTLRRLDQKILRKSLTILWDRLPGTTAFVDRRHLHQIVTNVIDNAVKYNRDGGEIRITVSAEDESAVIAIADTGIGMHEHEVARAHEPFVQFERTTDSLQGVGLGLSIVNRLIGANGGKIEIHSQKNVGTTVVMRLPLGKMMMDRNIA